MKKSRLGEYLGIGWLSKNIFPYNESYLNMFWKKKMGGIVDKEKEMITESTTFMNRRKKERRVMTI